MSPSERLFHRDYGFELLRLAAEDLKVAEALTKAVGIRREIILFHVQQAVEKSIKAVLCVQNRPLPMSHDLFASLQRLEADDLPPSGFALHDLTPYATIRRYEEGKFTISEEELQTALGIARDVIVWAKKKTGQ